MKKIILLASLLGFSFFVQGQILKKITDRAKNKPESNTNYKLNDKIDITVDDTMNGKDEKKYSKVKDTIVTPTGDTNQPASFKAFSKYDFVSIERKME